MQSTQQVRKTLGYSLATLSGLTAGAASAALSVVLIALLAA